MVVMVGCAGLMQEQLIFFPDSIDPDEDLAWTGADEEVFVEADDGAQIHALLFETDGEARGVVLYFHGNAGSVASWYRIGPQLNRHGLDVLLVDYRTYGKSTGEMSEEGLYLDGQATYEHLVDRGYRPESIIVHGRSLGSAVATRVATDYPVGAVVLETPFTNLGNLAGDLYPIPVPGWLLQYQFDNLGRAGDIEVPTWVVHGTEDQIVPVDHGRQIYDALEEPKQLTIIEGGGHNNLMSFTDYDRELAAFVDGVTDEPDEPDKADETGD